MKSIKNQKSTKTKGNIPNKNNGMQATKKLKQKTDAIL